MALNLQDIRKRLDKLKQDVRRENVAIERKREKMTPAQKRQHTITMRKQGEADTEWCVEQAMAGGAD